MKISRYEDLDCWKQARKLTNKVYAISSNLCGKKDFRLNDQIIGAMISVMNNIAEGFDSQSNNELIRFLKYSRRSVSEVINCLYICMDQKYIDQDHFNELYDEAIQTRKLIDGFLRYLRNNRNNRIN